MQRATNLTPSAHAVYVTNLPLEYNAWQIQQLYRDRADTENVFYELKNQWGFSGFCAKARATTELAARYLVAAVMAIMDRPRWDVEGTIVHLPAGEAHSGATVVGEFKPIGGSAGAARTHHLGDDDAGVRRGNDDGRGHEGREKGVTH